MISGNVIHKDNVKFPNFSQNAAAFPNSMGGSLAPFPKRGVRALTYAPVKFEVATPNGLRGAFTRKYII